MSSIDKCGILDPKIGNILERLDAYVDSNQASNEFNAYLKLVDSLPEIFPEITSEINRGLIKEIEATKYETREHLEKLVIDEPNSTMPLNGNLKREESFFCDNDLAISPG